jgi:ABC-2 type transport system ATP-binding protein
VNCAIETSGLTKRYGTRTVVDDVSVNVGASEIYAFLGLNGAGKTTTFRMLLGIVRPTTGWVRLLGERVSPSTHTLWSHVGYLVETPHAYPELTVRENLVVRSRLQGGATARAADQAIERFGLTAFANTPAGKLSLGNAQRLGLAGTMLHRPTLLILDEPTNSLDPAGVVEIRELLRDLARNEGVTIFVSSHILGEVARVATRIGVIHEGRLVQELSADELARRRQRRVVVETYDSAAARAALAGEGLETYQAADGSLEVRDERAVSHPERLAEILVRAGAPPSRLGVEHEDLEAYFLKLVSTAASRP